MLIYKKLSTRLASSFRSLFKPGDLSENLQEFCELLTKSVQPDDNDVIHAINELASRNGEIIETHSVISIGEAKVKPFVVDYTITTSDDINLFKRIVIQNESYQNNDRYGITKPVVLNIIAVKGKGSSASSVWFVFGNMDSDSVTATFPNTSRGELEQFMDDFINHMNHYTDEPIYSSLNEFFSKD